MDWIHASVLVMRALMALFAGLRIVSMLTGASDGLPESRVESVP